MKWSIQQLRKLPTPYHFSDTIDFSEWIKSVDDIISIDKVEVTGDISKIDEETFDEVAGDADTLAGLLLELKGEFPVLHEKVAYDCYEFEVLEMDNRRILKVKFTVNEPAGEGSETEK